MVCVKSQSVFTARLPELQRIARSAFRHLPYDRRDEAVQNVLTLAWKQYRALVLKGRDDAGEMLKSIVFYSIRQTKCGRAIQSVGNAKDAYEQRRRGGIEFEDIDPNHFIGRSTSIPDRVSFRLDMPRFLDTLNERQRKMAFDLRPHQILTPLFKIARLTVPPLDVRARHR